MYQLHKSDKSAFRAGTPTPKRNLSITNIAKIILQQNIFHLFLPTKYTKNQKRQVQVSEKKVETVQSDI